MLILQIALGIVLAVLILIFWPIALLVAAISAILLVAYYFRDFFIPIGIGLIGLYVVFLVVVLAATPVAEFFRKFNKTQIEDPEYAKELLSEVRALEAEAAGPVCGKCGQSNPRTAIKCSCGALLYVS